MSSEVDARARARALVREVLAEAGEPDPRGGTPTPSGPPPPPSEAQRRAHRIVQDVLAEEARRQDERRVEEAARRAEQRRAAEQARAAHERPDAQVDLLPAPIEEDAAQPAGPAEERRAGTEVPPIVRPEDLAREPDIDPGPPPPPSLPAPGVLLERWRQHRRRKRLQEEWAEDAAPPPRRTGRWLVATILLLAAIVLLFPLVVDALRDLVAL